MIRTAAILFAGALAAAPLPSPLSPADALKAFEVAPGLRVELVAAEPLVASPCAIAFDSQGRLFAADRPTNRIQILHAETYQTLDTWYQFSRLSGITIDK